MPINYIPFYTDLNKNSWSIKIDVDSLRRDFMKLDGLLIIKAFVSLFFGILLLAVPAKLGTIIGLELSSYGIFMAREYGGALIGIFFLCWFSRDSAGSKALNAVILWGFIYDLVNLIVAFAAILSGTMNSLGWAIVAVYLLFAIGFGYFLFLKPKTQ